MGHLDGADLDRLCAGRNLDSGGPIPTVQSVIDYMRGETRRIYPGASADWDII